MDRRDFVRRLGRAASLGALLPAARAAEAAGAPEPARNLPPAIQLYTLRTLMEREPEATLAALAAMGFEEVETAGLHGLEARELRAMLDRNGLRAPAGHVELASSPDPRTSPAWQRTLEEAVVLGLRWVVVPWIDESERTLDGYRRVAARFDAAGAAAREAGLGFAYHNHDFEFRAIRGAVPYHLLLDATDPELVRMEMDLYWVVHGGADPVGLFRRAPGRFPLLHVKDRDAEGRMVDIGAGTIDFAGILAHARLAGVRHAFLEHDDPPSPLDFARNGIRRMRELELER